MAPTWREEVRELISSFDHDDFTLGEVYESLGEIAARHPNNSTIRDTVRRVLQELRDEGDLAFVGRGEYRRLTSEAQPTMESLQSTSQQLQTREPGVPDSVPLERRSASEAIVNARDATVAVQREMQLVETLRVFLEERGHEVARWTIPTRSNSRLYTDIYDVTAGTLYEAKGDAKRESVRLAIGQLLDYRRYVKPAALSVLLPERPSQDMVELLFELGILCTFREAGTFRVARP